MNLALTNFKSNLFVSRFYCSFKKRGFEMDLFPIIRKVFEMICDVLRYPSYNQLLSVSSFL